MKILLAFPPSAQPFLPYLPLPVLTAVLKDAGFDAEQKDYNIEAYDFFLSKEYLEESGVSSYAAAGAEHLKKRIRTGHDFFLPSDYYGAVAEIDNYLKFLGAKYGNSYLAMKDYFIPGYDYANSEQVFEAARNRDINIFYSFFESKIEEIKETNPDVLGISIMWPAQLIPAFTLAGLVKKEMPDVHITMGGSLVSHFYDYLKQKRSVFRFVNSIIPFEGETSFVELVKTLESEGSLSGVPGLIWKKKKKVIFNELPEPANLESLPVPDFSGFPLDKYFSPQRYLPVSLSRGCYWGKCAFCSHHFSGLNYRVRSAESMFNELKELHEKYDCDNFYFIDDALPPSKTRETAIMIANSGMPLRWIGEIRMEKGLDREYFDDLYRGGCRVLLFGLESGSERVLSLMNKGITPAVAGEVLKNAHDAGIITWVFFMVGFPGERRNEAKQTLRFIIENSDYIDAIAGGKFVLTKNAPVYNEKDHYKIDQVFEEREYDLQLNYPYTLKEGITGEEAGLILEVFRRNPDIDKFLKSYFAEPHMLFFQQSYFAGRSAKKEE